MKLQGLETQNSGIEGDAVQIGDLWMRCRNPGGGFRSIAIRPENVGVSLHSQDDPTVNHLTGRLRRILNRGFYADIVVDVGGVSFHAIDSRRDLCRSAMAEGETVYLTIAPEDIHLIRDAPGGL